MQTFLFFFFLIFIFPFELLSRFVVLKYRAIHFAPRSVNSKTVPILSAFFSKQRDILGNTSVSLATRLARIAGLVLSSVHIGDFHPIM